MAPLFLRVVGKGRQTDAPGDGSPPGAIPTTGYPQVTFTRSTIPVTSPGSGTPLPLRSANLA